MQSTHREPQPSENPQKILNTPKSEITRTMIPLARESVIGTGEGGESEAVPEISGDPDDSPPAGVSNLQRQGAAKASAAGNLGQRASKGRNFGALSTWVDRELCGACRRGRNFVGCVWLRS
ncbi:hypothetical protein M758_9G016800 [Ceratodon purpureus]|nr:hypothetical protein M758_9G016800 [Ceratodon purpureus]